MNRRNFLKLLVGLLAALPFVKWTISKQQPESELKFLVKKLKSLNYDNLEGPQHFVNRYSQILAEDNHIVFFNMTDGQIAEAKAKWRESLNDQERGFFYRILTE